MRKRHLNLNMCKSTYFNRNMKDLKSTLMSILATCVQIELHKEQVNQIIFDLTERLTQYRYDAVLI